MLLKYLINTKPTIILFFIVFSIVFSCIPMLHEEFNLLYPSNIISSILVFIMALIIPTFHAVGLNNLVYENNIIKKDNFILGPVFLLLTAPFLNVISAWIISFLILFFIHFLFDFYQKEHPLSQTFNASIILGVIAVYSPSIIWYFPLIIICSLIFQNISWRIIIISLIGLLTPIIFYSVFCYLTDKNMNISIDFLSFNFKEIPTTNQLLLHEIIWFSVAVIICIFSIVELFSWLYKKSIRSRKSFILILFLFLFSIALVCCTNSWYMILTPLSIIIANYFVYAKSRKIANLLFLFFLISSFYYRIMITI